MKSKIAIAAFALAIFSINVVSQNAPKSESLILEITTEGIGMVYPRGERLDFRLYEDGRFEYDKLADLGKDPASTPPLTRKTSKLSAEQLEQLRSLMNDNDLKSAKARYETIRKHIDDYWFTTVRISSGELSKTIKVVNFWDVLSQPKFKAAYPDALVQLLFLTAKLSERHLDLE